MNLIIRSSCIILIMSKNVLYLPRFFLRRFTSVAKPLSEIPGPRPLLFIGNMKEAKELSEGKVWEEYALTKLTRKYGAIYKIHFMNTPMVVIDDADAVQYMFRNEGKIPTRSSVIEKNNKWIHEKNKMPVGLVMSYKNDWKRLRSAMTKQVTPRRLTHFTEPLSAVSDSLCDHMINTRDSEGWVSDIWQPMQRWALKGTTKVVFNEDMNTFSDNDSQTEKYVKAVLAFTHAFGEVNRALPLYKIFPTKVYRNYISSYSDVRQLGKELLNNRYESIRKDIEEGTVDEDIAVGLLDQWLIEGKLTEEEAIVQACDMLAAGIDTTSNTATFLLHELAKNPVIQEALHKEIVEIVGPHATPTAEQLQKLSLVRKCVKETLRLHPLVPLVSRELAIDSVILGYHIPAGTTCIFNFFTLSKDPRYFKDPTVFNPERWSHDSDEIHSFASLPFGFGPRGCYGRRIAELELHLLLTRIMQKFKLSTDQTSLKQSFYTVLHPEEPVKIRFST